MRIAQLRIGELLQIAEFGNRVINCSIGQFVDNSPIQQSHNSAMLAP